MIRTALHFLQTLLIRGLLTITCILPLDLRAQIVGRVMQGVTFLVPPLRTRIDGNLDQVYPSMDRRTRRQLVGKVARNAGATLTEILFNADYAQTAKRFTVTGPGLEALNAARAEGRGALLVSGHFGQWEAIRHALRARGIEVGALYRPNNNPYYEPLFRRAIEIAGTPIIPKGPAGNRQLMRHLQDGGVMALLVDQYLQDGEVLDFLGLPASTTLSAAKLALRYDIPLIPVFGTRRGREVCVEMEAPIPPGAPVEMMQDFNDRLGARVLADPGQWNWYHQRWRPRRYATAWPPDGWSPRTPGP